MRGRELNKLRGLMELDDGRVLASTVGGDKYYLVDTETDSAEAIDVLRASRLWLEGQSKGWRRDVRTRLHTDAATLEGAEFHEALRRKLNMDTDD